MLREYFKNWWQWLKYDPSDPRHFAGKTVRIAVIGGGSGLSMLLQGLKSYSDDISAIVAVTDDGRSSGVLRREFDMIPPGDIRKCISALAYDEEMISALMEYRIKKKNNSLSGHTLGNIWLAALSEYFGSFEKAVEATTSIFKTAGKVLPATLDNVGLRAIYTDKSEAIGESNIPDSGKVVDKVFLDHANIRSYKKSVGAIASADLIVIGPGSLYTSVIPNLLISGIRKAVIGNKLALKVYVVNCSTERGETENFSVEDHIRAIEKHAGKRMFDTCIVNNKIIKRSKKESNLGEVNNITTNEKYIMGYKIVSKNIISETNPLYHDSDKLAKSLMELYNKCKHESRIMN